MSILKKTLQAFENVLLCLLLASMLILSIVQITLRLQDSGLFWITPLLRLLVLWTGLMGAVVEVLRLAQSSCLPPAKVR